MADLFLVLFLYALMLGVGPAVAWLMGRRATLLLREKKAALEEELGRDPTVLIDARPDASVAFTAVEDGVELHIDEGELTSALRTFRAHAHGIELGWRTTLYIGVPVAARRAIGERVTPLGQRIFGPRIEVRAADTDLAETLLEIEEVREALLDVFHGPMFGLAIELTDDGTLNIDVRLDYDPDVIRALRRRAQRLVVVLRAHSKLEAKRRLPEGAAKSALPSPSGHAVGITPFRDAEDGAGAHA